MSSGTKEYFNGVWASGSKDVLAVGTGGAFHWDGVAWSKVTTGSTDTLHAVHGSSPNNVWAASWAWPHLAGGILKWDGKAWDDSISTTPSSFTVDLNDVWASGPNNVWATGDGVGQIYHYNTGSAKVWAVGTHGAFLGRTP